MTCEKDYRRVRNTTQSLLAGLGPEDCMVQAMPDVSPTKWHLAHTTWFFETFVLARHDTSYRSPPAVSSGLFNSYYESIGGMHPREERGYLSRPTLSEILAYREHVDAAMQGLLLREETPVELVLLGLSHEQQHQELMVMDLKYNFSRNPLRPAYRPSPLEPCEPAAPLEFERFDGGLVSFGDSARGFAFDNERPAHRRFLEPFELATRLVTNGEMLEFVSAGGYRTPSLWLSDGWAWVQAHGVHSPLYWAEEKDGSISEFTTHGRSSLDPNAPVCHVSAYEAAAFATFAGTRLPTEFEWELAARNHDPEDARWLGERPLHPRGTPDTGMQQLFGEVWEWTRSAYDPYPGFTPAAGAIGEYNGKFMCGQWVLRGGSFATPRGHVRSTYRNFFYPHQRWPFTGIRLAREVQP